MSDHKTWYLKSDSRDFLCKIHLNHQNHHMRGVILRSRLSANGGKNQKSYFNAKNGTFHIHSYKLGACNVKLYNNKKTERLKILESLHLQGDLGQNIGILLDICFSFRNTFFSWFHNWQHKTNLRLTTWQRRSRPFWMWWHIVLGSYFPTDKSGGMDFENFKFLFFCVNFSITLSTSTRKLRNQ